MTRPTGTMSLVVQRVVLCVFALAVLLDIGCVSRRTYERVTAETVEHTQALEGVRADVRELDLEIAGLQASNQREDAVVSELRASMQREEEQLPIMRQRAEDALSLLKTQVATLMNQSWHLARKIVDIRHESASLQTKVAHYKEELAQAQLSTVVASNTNEPAIAQAAVSEPPASIAPVTPSAPVPQIEEVSLIPQTPAPANPATPSPSVMVDPPSTNDSWIGIITSWFSKIWNWLFG